MGNGPYELPHVALVQQRNDNTIVVQVQTNSFNPGQEVEVSVVLSQGNDYYASSSGITHIPPDDPSNPGQPAVLPVELPPTELNAGQDVTVVTRVTEVWPSVLRQASVMDQEGYQEKGLKAVWTYPAPQGEGLGAT